MKLKASLALAFGLLTGTAFAATELVIATVNNGHMIEMQKLTKHFESANPDIKVKWSRWKKVSCVSALRPISPPRVASST